MPQRLLTSSLFAAAVLATTTPAAPAAAQQQSTRVDSGLPVVAVARAVRAAPAAPVLDGRLDDAAWGAAPVLDGFRQREPHEGQPGTERTEARVVYTDDAVYVGVRAYDSQADRIAAQLTRRDESSPSDWIGIAIDSYHDRRTAFQFAVNPAGVKRDIYHYDDGNEDSSWDAVWDVAVSRDAGGWTAEFRIPFSQLRFTRQDEQTFGFEVYRKIARLNEDQHWKLIPRNASGIVSQFGELHGIEDVSPPRRLEVMPYTVGSADLRAAEAGNPFQTGNAGRGSAGVDLKAGIGSNLTLQATVNPDFGQVEADPAQVNLSAFESFFSERRPFFSEGTDIFQLPGSTFYSRRIGRAPQGSADRRGGYAQQIRQSNILGAAKLSGKSNGWTIGALGALTSRETATVVDSLGQRHADVVEPLTGYFVGRLGREWNGGKSRVGLHGTAVRRDLAPNLGFLRREAFTAGANWGHKFRRETYWFDGWLTVSSVRGSADAITRTQRSSARYFQRPDNDYVTFDSTRTSLTGLAGQIGFGKNGGGNWRFSTGVDTRSPGFEANDAGFHGSVDWHGQWFWLQRRWTTPGKVFREAFVNLNQWSNWSYGWDRTSLGGNINLNYKLLNYWGGWAGFNYNFPQYSTNALRGGPVFIRPRGFNPWFGFYSDDRKPVQVEVDGWFFRQAAKETWGYGGSIDLRVRPAANVDFSLGPSYQQNSDDWQYLKDATVLGQTERIFGWLKQTTVSANFRGNITLKPELTIQLYAQPFIAAGHYLDFKRVADPRAATYEGRFDEFGPDRLIRTGREVAVDLNRDGTADIDLGDPDFTVLSFRSNAVLRWEYRPGSTIFLVWQHGRGGNAGDGRFDLGRDLGNLFRTEAENTFLVKVNYWLSL